MAWSSWSTLQESVWGSGNSPTIYFQWQYRYDRSGANMMYQVWCRMRKPSGTYGYNIYCSCYMDGVYKFGTYLKDSSSTSWTYFPSDGYYSSTFYINKTSGSTTLKFNVYSPNAGTSRSTDFTQSMTVTPAGSAISVTAPGGSYVLGDNTKYAQINLTRYSTSFTDTLSSNPSGLSASITGSTSSYDWKPIPISFANNNTTGTTVPVTVTTVTSNGGTTIESKSASFTATIPATVKPTTPVISITDGMGYAANYGGYIQSLSRADIVMSSNTYSSGGYTDNAAITSATIVAGGSSYSPSISRVGSTNQYRTNTLSIVTSTVGTRSVSGTVTDTRSRSTSSATTNISVLPYYAPTISGVTAYRSDVNGVATADGTYVVLQFDAAAIAPIDQGGSYLKNQGNYSITYTITNSGGTVTTTNTVYINNTSANISNEQVIAADQLPATSSLNATFRAQDSFGKYASTSTTVRPASKFLHANAARTGLGVGMLSTKPTGGLEIGMDAYLKDRNLETLFYRLGGWSDLSGTNNTQLTSIQDVITRSTEVGEYKVFISGLTNTGASALTGHSASGIIIAKRIGTSRVDYIATAGNNTAMVTGSIDLSTSTATYSDVGSISYDLITSW